MTTSGQDSDAQEPHMPSWQRLPCPGWCTRTHHEDDHVEDRYHRSEPSYVPVLAVTEATVPITEALEPLDLIVTVGQYADELIEWVSIEAVDRPEPRMVLTLSSAHSLTRTLIEQLQRHAEG